MNDAIYFHSPEGLNGYLSNSYICSFNLDGWQWRSVEHYIQASKFTGLMRVFHEIRETPEPMEAKKFAEYCESYCRPDWFEIREETMRAAIERKFTDPGLRRALIGTGNATLIHDSEDEFWGCGKNGDGKNRLGKILMESRARLSMAA